LDIGSFIISYNGQPLTNSMDITTITEDEAGVGAIHAFHIIRRPVAVNIEFRTVEHGTLRLSVHLFETVESLYKRVSFLTGWSIGNFTLRHENRTLDDPVVNMTALGISGDAFMVMVGSLAGGTQRFNIGSPCAAAASRLDESDISDMDLETESSTSMPDMGRLAVAASSALLLPMPSSMKQLSSSSPLLLRCVWAVVSRTLSPLLLQLPAPPVSVRRQRLRRGAPHRLRWSPSRPCRCRA
jgi:hypothetical protein